jgi:hypothetical protein
VREVLRSLIVGQQHGHIVAREIRAHELVYRALSTFDIGIESKHGRLFIRHVILLGAFDGYFFESFSGAMLS